MNLYCLPLKSAARPLGKRLENTDAYCPSYVRTAGVGIVAWFILAIISAVVSEAATKEEVERCRAIEQRAERANCFKSLRPVPKAKTESPAPGKTEDAAAAKAKPGSPTGAGNNTNTNVGDTVSPPTSDDPATSIDRLGVAPGQPLCLDRDALAAMVLTANPTEAATNGCQSLPGDAKLDLLERYPSIFPSLRIIRVKVTSPTHPDLTSGFTIEMGR